MPTAADVRPREVVERHRGLDRGVARGGVPGIAAQHGLGEAQHLGRRPRLGDDRLRPTGRRLVAVSNSGAVGVLAADAASLCGMEMAALSGQTQDRLRAILPGFAATANPVDITAALLTNSRLFGDILPVIAADPAADAFLIGVPVAGQGYDVEAFARDTAAFADVAGKPVAVAAPQPPVAEGEPVRGQRGVVVPLLLEGEGLGQVVDTPTAGVSVGLAAREAAPPGHAIE